MRDLRNAPSGHQMRQAMSDKVCALSNRCDGGGPIAAGCRIKEVQ